MVSVSVVANERSEECLVEHERAEHNVGVVELVIVANPRSDESPRGFPSGRITKSGHLVGFTAYGSNTINVKIVLNNVEVIDDSAINLTYILRLVAIANLKTKRSKISI